MAGTRDEIDRRETSGAGGTCRLRTAFLVGNPQSFGFVPDAVPVASRRLLAAANGYNAARGAQSPLYELDCSDAHELLRGQLDMLPPTDDAADILHMTFFAAGGEHQEHPLARVCAVLCQALGWHILSEAAENASYASLSEQLSQALPEALQAFRTSSQLAGRLKTTAAAVDDVFFNVSFAAVRACPGESPDEWRIGIFSAGDFSVFLLDGEGMSPLWTKETPPVSLSGFAGLGGRELTLRHPGPFALLLLSDGAVCPVPAEAHALAEKPSLIWYQRMRCEERILRIIDRAVSDGGFEAAATRLLSGRATGRDSASGAMTILGDPSDRMIRADGDDAASEIYASFRKIALDRLSRLGESLSLLNSYDPDHLPSAPPCRAQEQAYTQRLLLSRPSLAAACRDLLSRLAETRLAELRARRGGAAEREPVPPVLTFAQSGSGNAPEDPIRRLRPEDVRAAFRAFDKENDADRDAIEKNRRFLSGALCDHWVTLRPLLTAEPAEEEDPSSPTSDTEEKNARPAQPEGREEPGAADRLYESCLSLNRRLSEVKHRREETLGQIRSLLADTLKTLDESSADWIMGRGAADAPLRWADTLTGRAQEDALPVPPGRPDAPDAPASLPGLLSRLNGWESRTSDFVRLRRDYASRRRQLFTADTAPGGIFAASCEQVLNGTLPPVTWSLWRISAEGMPEYVRLLDVLRTVSERTGELYGRVRARSAERRCILSFAEDDAWRMDAVRAAVYADPDWDAADLVDEGVRNEYKNVVRHFREERALRARRQEAWEGYKLLYTLYESR